MAKKQSAEAKNPKNPSEKPAVDTKAKKPGKK